VGLARILREAENPGVAPEHFTFETLHSAWSAKINFAYASGARPTLTLSAVRAISK
jgi:hypothetical protein